MSDDPLDGADVGETRAVRESVDLHTAEFRPAAFYGTDRIGTGDVAGIEVVEDEYGDEVVRVDFEGDLTKALPPRWDYCAEPVTEEQRRSERRWRWASRLGRWGVHAAMFGVSVLIAHRLMQDVAGKLTVNGEPMHAPTLPELAAPFAVLFLLLVVFEAVVIPRLPRRASGGWR